MAEPHPVYPGGPPCTDSCPGEWSSYHDGYSWGYEKGQQDRAAPQSEAVAPETLGRFRLAVDAAIENIAHGRVGAAVAGLRAAREADATENADRYERLDWSVTRDPVDNATVWRARLTQTRTLGEDGR
jgi:hypothetical protein